MGMKPANRSNTNGTANRGRGRPPLPPGEARNLRVQIAVNQAEYDLIALAAREVEGAGQFAFGRYARSRLLKGAKADASVDTGEEAGSILASLRSEEG